MKIRSVYELNEAMRSALSWRRKELEILKMLIKKHKRKHERYVALHRAAVPVLYAHWEGFVKQAATFYLELVSRQWLKLSELSSNFVTIACRSHFKNASDSDKVSVQEKLIVFLRKNNDKRVIIPTGGVIDTESNLKSTVLKSIFSALGLEYDAFWIGKELLIDGSLLKYRNEIAHGENTDIDEATYEQLHELVIELLENMKTYIENAAINRKYRV